VTYRSIENRGVMSKSKAQKGNALVVSLAITLTVGSATIQSLVGAQSVMAAPSNWYDNENTFFDRGKTDYQSGQFDQAIKDLTDCIKLNPRRTEAYFIRSSCYSALHQNDQAISDLDQAVRLDPNNGVIFLNRGLIYSNQGKNEAAISDFDQAIKLDSSLSDARQNKLFCLQELEKTKGAQQKVKEQADQTAAAAAGGNVLAMGTGNTAGGASSAAASSNAATTNNSGSSNIAANGYTPFTGKATAKRSVPPKQQTEPNTAIVQDKAKVAELAKLQREREQLAIDAQKADLSFEREMIKKRNHEAQLLAKTKAPVVQTAIEDLPGKKRQEPKSDKANVELSTSGRQAADADALEIVNRPVRDKWALIVGISEFKDTKLNLHYPAKDAKDFYNFLVNEGNFAKDHVKLLTNDQATRANILSELGDKWLPHVANPDDLVLIYISSHGSPSEMDVVGVNYLLAYDTDVDNLLASGLPMQDLTGVIKTRVHSDRVVVVLDACHSGGAEPGAKGLKRTTNVDADAVAQGTGQLVISSSSTSQVSWESKKYENSVFTRCLIESLRKNGNATTLGEAFKTMQDEVRTEVLQERGVLQEPVLKSRWKGSELRISVPPAAPRVGI
jgi:tetratricopeptide (TPR) repeat protein